ncbi:MAG: hypothetical protein AB1777_11280 [Bacteroidota bacterium]
MNTQKNPTLQKLKAREVQYLEPLNATDMLNINGGTWLSYWLGYILSSIDNNVPNEDQTRYGGAYLETISGRSSIM